MKSAGTNPKRFFVVACVSCALCLSFSVTTWGQQIDPEELARATRSMVETKHPTLSSGLSALAEARRSRSAQDLRDLAEDNQIFLSGNSALVTVYVAEGSDPEEVTRLIERSGGEVSARLDYSLEAWVPLDRLEEVSRSSLVRYVGQTPPLRTMMLPNSVVSEGVDVTQVQRLHQAGITGQRVTIGVLDLGFRGLAEAQRRGELPSGIPARSFSRAGLDGAQSTEHGTACAEIVHDMAPGARLVLAQIDTLGEIINAVNWLHQQGVQIISFSAGTSFGPFDGRALIDRFVDDVSAQYNILWVVAAGNEASHHWGGTFRDADGDSMHEFLPGDEAIDLTALGGPFAVLMSWDDWGEDPDRPNSTQDYDLFILDQNRRVVARSDSYQNGSQPPVEMLGARALPRGARMLLAIKRYAATRAVNFHIFVFGAQMTPTNPSGSVANPGTARSSLAVGAIHWQRRAIEDFSSQGPTDDGRLKPEVCAPDAVRTAAYNSAFYGTSAATPHVAGFAALLRQMHGSVSQARLKELTMRFVEDLGSPGPDNVYGTGLISGSNVEGGDTEVGEGEGGGEAQDLSTLILASLDSMRREGTLLQALNRLAELSSADDFNVTMAASHRGDPPVYHYGESLKIGFRVSRRSFVALLHLDPDGEWHFIIPRGAGSLMEVGTGQRVLFPPMGQPGLRVGPPAGSDRFFCVAVTESVDLRQILRGETRSLRGRVAVGTLRVETRR